jgi:hypothetical protein
MDTRDYSLVKWHGHEADDSTSPIAKVKNGGAILSISDTSS